MSDKDGSNAGWILACVYALAMPLAFSVFANWEHLPTVARRLWSQEAAGWAQAFGSMAAIIGGFRIAEASSRAARRLALEQDEERTKSRQRAAFGLARAFAGQASIVVENLSSADRVVRAIGHGEMNLRALRVHLQGLERFPIELIDHEEGIEAFIDLSSLASVMIDVLARGPATEIGPTLSVSLEIAEGTLRNIFADMLSDVQDRVTTIERCASRLA